LLILIVKKSKENLYIYVNYQVFNTLIIKNCNILFLIRDSSVRLYIVKFYIKFDIIVVFNKIRIRKSNKYKIVFIIKYNLFEYVIILFDLYNVSNNFQVFINKILRKYLNDFCFIYLDNILIYSKT